VTQFQNATHKRVVVVNPKTGQQEIRFKKREKSVLPNPRTTGGMIKKGMARGGRAENPISRNKKNYRSTKSGAGMTKAGVAAYRRAIVENHTALDH